MSGNTGSSNVGVLSPSGVAGTTDLGTGNLRIKRHHVAGGLVLSAVVAEALDAEKASVGSEADY